MTQGKTHTFWPPQAARFLSPAATREDAETTTGKRKVWGKQAKMLAISCTAPPDGALPTSSHHQVCKLTTRLSVSSLIPRFSSQHLHKHTGSARDSHLAEVRAVGCHHKCLPRTLNSLRKMGNLTPAVMLALEKRSQVPTLCTTKRPLLLCPFHQLLLHSPLCNALGFERGLKSKREHRNGSRLGKTSKSKSMQDTGEMYLAQTYPSSQGSFTRLVDNWGWTWHVSPLSIFISPVTACLSPPAFLLPL